MARVEMYGFDANRQPVRKVANSPVGAIYWYPVETPPEGTLVCNGGAVSRTAYAELFAVLGIKYGAGDGVSTFNLPDLRGKFVRGTGGNAAELGVAQEATKIGYYTGGLSGSSIAIMYKDSDSLPYYPTPNNVIRYQPGSTIAAPDNTEYITIRPVNVALLPCIIYE